MDNKNRPIYVSTPGDVPKCEHWAIIEGTSVTIPGDERSRQAPGHGYPEHVERYVSYIAFLDEEAFTAALEKQLSERFAKPCIGVHVHGAYQASTKIVLVKPS